MSLRSEPLSASEQPIGQRLSTNHRPVNGKVCVYVSWYMWPAERSDHSFEKNKINEQKVFLTNGHLRRLMTDWSRCVSFAFRTSHFRPVCSLASREKYFATFPSLLVISVFNRSVVVTVDLPVWSMTNSNRSSYIRVEDPNQSALNELFSVVSNPNKYVAQRSSKPFRDRGLPESFFQPPSSSPNNSLSKSAATSSNSISTEQPPPCFTPRLHAKNQLSLPNIPSPSTTFLRTIIKPNLVQGHLRAASDTAVLDGQGTSMASTNSNLSQINSQASLLPLPDAWEERQTPDGQIYYIE